LVSAIFSPTVTEKRLGSWIIPLWKPPMRLESGQWSFDVPGQGSVTLPFRTSFAMFCQRLAWKKMEKGCQISEARFSLW